LSGAVTVAYQVPVSWEMKRYGGVLYLLFVTLILGGWAAICFIGPYFLLLDFARQRGYVAKKKKRPNKAPEPTPGAVTPRATKGASK